MDINTMISDATKGLTFVYKDKGCEDRMAVVEGGYSSSIFNDGRNCFVHIMIVFRITNSYKTPSNILHVLRKKLKGTFVESLRGKNKRWLYVRAGSIGNLTTSSSTRSDNYDCPGVLNFLVKYKPA